MIWEVSLIALIAIGALSLVWTTVRSGMSPMPSSRAARAAVVEALQGTSGPIADLGSGWGHLAITVARQFPDRQVVGYELSWLPWLTSVVAGRLLGLPNLRFRRTDAFTALAAGRPFAAVTLICYLHGPGMTRLAETLRTQNTSVEWIVSNNFALPGLNPEHRWRLRDFHGSPVYRYRWFAERPQGSATRTQYTCD